MKIPNLKYELLGAICFQRDNLASSRYFTLVKKQHKAIKKEQWYEFTANQFKEITENDVKNNYIAQILFYRKIEDSNSK